MRTSIKVSAIVLGASAMLGASASTASAGGWGWGHSSRTTLVCGNTAQKAVASDGGIMVGVDQEANAPVFCQNGKGNAALNFTPDFDYFNFGLREANTA